MFISLNVLMVFGAVLLVAVMLGLRHVAQLQNENRELQSMTTWLADRIHKQSELLSKKAEKNPHHVLSMDVGKVFIDGNEVTNIFN